MKTNTKEKVAIEYEDAPSGSVVFYNYKEPLMPFEGGFGFEGALVFDAVSEKIQCHFCGKWYEVLGNHLIKEHNMRAAEYKEKVGLNKSTALINETHRAKLIANGQARFKNLRPGKKKTQAEKDKIKILQGTWPPDNFNRRGRRAQKEKLPTEVSSC